MQTVLDLLRELGIPCTFFVTGRFAERCPQLVRDLSTLGEIASHGLTHTGFRSEDLAESKHILHKLTDKDVIGFRMPRLAAVQTTELIGAGYLYDSSLNPTYIPGRYNHFASPCVPHWDGDLCVIPTSVATALRVPLFWLSFRHVPEPIYRYLSSCAIAQHRYLCLYFHPWEFVDLSRFRQIPPMIRSGSGTQLLGRLRSYLLWLRGSHPQCRLCTGADLYTMLYNMKNSVK